MSRVAIAGAGVAGLSAALHLRDLCAQRGGAIAIDVYDPASRPGGCIETVRENGFLIEAGPDSILTDKPAGMALLRRLGLDGELIPMQRQFAGARIVHHGRLRPLPPEFRLFSPRSIPALLRSGIFTPAGILRAAAEPFVPARRSGGDESLASFVRRRFGREILDRLAQPLVGGIYSADPARLSMQASLPQFLEMERDHGSVMRALAAQRSKTPPPKLMTLRAGLSEIVEALQRELADVTFIRQAVPDASELRRTYDAAIFAIPAYAAAGALRASDHDLAAMLEDIRYNSIATIALAFDRAAIPELPRTQGFVVPHVERRNIVAATIVSQKYEGRSPDETVLLRAFAGGALAPEMLDLDDAHLIGAARVEFRALLGISAEPVYRRVWRMMRLLPEYGVGHVSRVAHIRERLSALGPFAVAGSAYDGVGIPDCAQSGLRAAEAVYGALQ